MIKKTVTIPGLLVLMTVLFSLPVKASPVVDSFSTSTREAALAYVEGIKDLGRSKFWPFIRPSLFLENLKINVSDPYSVYPGRGTNFCGYGALSYLFLKDDPLGFAKTLVTLYKEGTVTFGKITLTPSDAIRTAAGRLRFKGILDIRPAEQLWYLCLADHFKGYLNIFNRKYDPGDEDKFWASVNYAKFNRMVRELLQYKVRARGSDLFRPSVKDLYGYLTQKLKEGPVVLYINNMIIHRKNHDKIKLAVPTHFVVLQDIYRSDDVFTLVYWDYGHKTQIQLRPYFLQKIIFGISSCSRKEND